MAVPTNVGVTAGKQRRWAGTFGTSQDINTTATIASSVTLTESDVITVAGQSTVSTVVNEYVMPAVGINGREIALIHEGPTGTAAKQRIKNGAPATGTVEYIKMQKPGDAVIYKAMNGAWHPSYVGGASQSTAT